MNGDFKEPTTLWELTRKQWIRIVLPTVFNTMVVVLCVVLCAREYSKVYHELEALKRVCPVP